MNDTEVRLINSNVTTNAYYDPKHNYFVDLETGEIYYSHEVEQSPKVKLLRAIFEDDDLPDYLVWEG